MVADAYQKRLEHQQLTQQNNQVFKVKLFDALNFCGNNYEYILTPYHSYNLIVRDKQWRNIYIEHKETDIKYLDSIQRHGLMFNLGKLKFYKKYMSGSFIIIATTINDKIYWVQYDISFNEFWVHYDISFHKVELYNFNEEFVFIPFNLFSNDIDLLAEKIVIYFNQNHY